MSNVHHAIEMAMDLVIIPTTLVQKRELKECPDIGPSVPSLANAAKSDT